MRDVTVYGPLTLPSGKTIRFRRPTGADRLNVTKTTSIGQDEIVSGTLLVQTYLASKVVTEVDGKAITDGDYRSRLNDWDDADVQYYQAIYSEMFGVSEDKQTEIKEKAAFLLKNLTSTDGSSSANDATSTPGSQPTTN